LRDAYGTSPNVVVFGEMTFQIWDIDNAKLLDEIYYYNSPITIRRTGVVVKLAIKFREPLNLDSQGQVIGRDDTKFVDWCKPEYSGKQDDVDIQPDSQDPLTVIIS
jgi:hypothetical protein